MSVKRILDLAVSVPALLVVSPLLGLVALCIRFEDGSPIFYRQQRVGKNGQLFELLKFRSMQVHDIPAGETGQITEFHPLVTSTGRWIRRFKVDELPQLVNVLRGDASLVGPRPTLPGQVAEYDANQRRRLEVPPGLTGWSQINGNVRLSWEDRIRLDLWYIDHWSLWLDLRILFRTAKVIALGEQVDPKALQEARDHEKRTYRSC